MVGIATKPSDQSLRVFFPRGREEGWEEGRETDLLSQPTTSGPDPAAQPPLFPAMPLLLAESGLSPNHQAPFSSTSPSWTNPLLPLFLHLQKAANTKDITRWSQKSGRRFMLGAHRYSAH